MKIFEISTEDLLKKGEMVIAPWDMTPVERQAWYKLNQMKARNYLFSIGQPLVFEKEGQMIAEYADGTIEVVR
jgi:hypothetical protein